MAEDAAVNFDPTKQQGEVIPPEVYDAFDKEYQEARAFATWTPPDGPHLAYLSDVREGRMRGGAPYVILESTIADGEHAGRSFTLGVVVLDKSRQDLQPALGRFKQIYYALGGTDPHTLKQAVEFLRGRIGTVFTVQVRTQQRGDRKFTTYQITNVHPDIEATEPVEPPDVAEAEAEVQSDDSEVPF